MNNVLEVFNKICNMTSFANLKTDLTYEEKLTFFDNVETFISLNDNIFNENFSSNLFSYDELSKLVMSRKEFSDLQTYILEMNFNREAVTNNFFINGTPNPSGNLGFNKKQEIIKYINSYIDATGETDINKLTRITYDAFKKHEIEIDQYEIVETLEQAKSQGKLHDKDDFVVLNRNNETENNLYNSVVNAASSYIYQRGGVTEQELVEWLHHTYNNQVSYDTIKAILISAQGKIPTVDDFIKKYKESDETENNLYNTIKNAVNLHIDETGITDRIELANLVYEALGGKIPRVTIKKTIDSVGSEHKLHSFDDYVITQYNRIKENYGVENDDYIIEQISNISGRIGKDIREIIGATKKIILDH